MSKHTLKLPPKLASEPAIQPVKEITAADVMEWLKKNTLPNVATGAPIDAPPANQVPDPAFDWKYDAPVESKPFDLSTLTPANARSVPIQLPPRSWGNPRFATPP